MNEILLGKNDEVVMKLLHYFITEKGYHPIILHGVQDEVWLENMDSEYEVVRIVSSYIHNDEQLNMDLFKTKQIVRKIKKTTFSLRVNTLSLFVNLGDNVHVENYQDFPKIDVAKITQMKDLDNYDFIKETFPNITIETDLKEEGMNLFFKVTEEISKTNEKTQRQAESILEKKVPIITYTIIAINVLLFFLMYILGNGSEDNATLLYFGANLRELVLLGDYYRLFTCMFLHIGPIHLLCNMYVLYVIGSQIESFYGKGKYLLIYLFSGLCGSILSMTTSMTISAGASGAIFGLFGALLYFGYHYRVYLGSVMRSQVVPLILLNLGLGFVLPGIDVLAHIGGLVGGTLMSACLGIKYNENNFVKGNAIFLTIIFFTFICYLAFFLPM